MGESWWKKLGATREVKSRTLLDLLLFATHRYTLDKLMSKKAVISNTDY